MARYLHFRWTNAPGSSDAPPYFNGPAGAWQPPLNAYRCEESIVVCFDLAGVDKERIDIRIEPGRLIVRGVRKTPEPGRGEPCPQQILAMEIDHGPFLRELRLPAEVVREAVTAEHRNGLLWVTLPLSHE